MGLHVWDCIYGTACVGLHVWECMCGTACVGLHVWDRMGAVCRIVDAARIASLSSMCISAETIVQLLVMTLLELQSLQL